MSVRLCLVTAAIGRRGISRSSLARCFASVRRAAWIFSNERFCLGVRLQRRRFGFAFLCVNICVEQCRVRMERMERMERSHDSCCDVGFGWQRRAAAGGPDRLIDLREGSVDLFRLCLVAVVAPRERVNVHRAAGHNPAVGAVQEVRDVVLSDKFVAEVALLRALLPLVVEPFRRDRARQLSLNGEQASKRRQKGCQERARVRGR